MAAPLPKGRKTTEVAGKESESERIRGEMGAIGKRGMLVEVDSVRRVKATDWQKHSIRGFLSTAAKKHGLKIESTKTEAGDRVYQIKK